MRTLLAVLLGRRRAPAPPPRDSETDRLMRIYRETAAELRDLRRAA